MTLNAIVKYHNLFISSFALLAQHSFEASCRGFCIGMLQVVGEEYICDLIVIDIFHNVLCEISEIYYINILK